MAVFVWAALGLVSKVRLFKPLQYKQVQKAAWCITVLEPAPGPTNLDTSVFFYLQVPGLSIWGCNRQSHSTCVKTLLQRGIQHLSEAFSVFIAELFFTSIASGTVGCGRADTWMKCLVLSEQKSYLPKVGVFVLQIVWSLWCNNSQTCSETIHLVQTWKFSILAPIVCCSSHTAVNTSKNWRYCLVSC